MAGTPADITIVGLGPGDAARRTAAAQQALDGARVIFLRDGLHPALDDLLAHGNVQVVDKLVPALPSGRMDWAKGAAIICDATVEGPVVLAIPGHPRFGERLVIETISAARQRNVTLGVIDGLSALDLMASRLGIDPMVEDVQLVDAAKLVADIGTGPFSGGMIPFSPLRPLMLFRVYGRGVARPLSALLQRIFPADHPAIRVEGAGIHGLEHVTETTIAGIADEDRALLASLFIPSLGELDAVRDPRTLQHIVARLRRPDGCPWDRKQDHHTLRDSIIDEAYEVLDAIDAGDDDNLAEELGDLLLLVMMHAQIAEEAGTFTLEDVYEGISRKIVRRHPHVFGDMSAEDAGEVIGLWNDVKAQEKAERPEKPEKAADGQPHSMPALTRAPRVLKKHPTTGNLPQSTADERSQALLAAVANIVAAGDDPEQVLRQALIDHVMNTNT
jgi:tetrapyrrole methylase family protein / MazG family protein